MMSSKLSSLADPHPTVPTDAPSAAVTLSGGPWPMEPKQSLSKATDRSLTNWSFLSIEEPRLADMWVPGILFVLPPCLIIALVTAFPNHTFGVLGTSILGLWCFAAYTVKVPLLREKIGISSIMAVHGHYFCCCLLYGVFIYGNDESWIDYAVKAVALLTILPLAVLFLWSVDTRRWTREHPCNDPVLCSMFPVLPIVLQVVKRSNSWLYAYHSEAATIEEV